MLNLKTFPERRLYQMAGVISAVFWLSALLYKYPDGLRILEMGWLLPLNGLMGFKENPFTILFCFGWYANLFLLILWPCLWLGRCPYFRFSSIVLGLALTGILPIPFFDFEVSGTLKWQSLATQSLSPWFWLASFAVIWGAALYGRKKSANT